MAISLPEFSKPEDPVLVTYIALAAIGIILNITCIVFIVKQKRKLRSFEILLIHLMVVDTIVATTAMLLASALLFDYNKTGKIQYIITVHIFVGTSYQMTLVILSISINRLFAVKYPLKHRFHTTRKKTLIASAFMWLIFLAYLVAMFIITSLQRQILNPFELPEAPRIIFITITCTIAAVFIIINIEILRLILQKNTTSQGITRHTEPTRPHERRLLATTIMIIICFCICTVPRVHQFVKKKGEIRAIAALLVNCIMNPILYFVIAELRRRNSETSRRRQNSTGTS